MERRFITFLTDYGLDDPFVGICHGVMRRIAPDADVIDVTHGIPPQDVARGALVLESALPYMPAGVHLAVVDPGVGGDRRAVAVEGVDGRLHVGPDNGLLLPALDRLGGIARAVVLESEEHALSPISATFHGRDVFAPAAAHLAAGVALDELGPPLPAEELVRLSLAEPRVDDGALRATVVEVDRFGNVAFSARPADLAAAGIEGERLVVEAHGAWLRVHRGRTFRDVGEGNLVLFADSADRLALAANRGDASRVARLGAGDEVVLRRA